MNNFLKNNNNEIDFENLEAELNKRIDKRKNIEGYGNNIEDIKLNKQEVKHDSFKHDDFLNSLSPYCDIKIDRNISSHRPVVGPALVKVRKLLDEEIRRSVDPVIEKQIEFNRMVVENFKMNLDKTHGELEFLRKRTVELGEHIEENIHQTNFNIKEIFKLRRKIGKNGN